MQQVVRPLPLFTDAHAVEELGRLLGVAKFSDTVQRHHRPRELLLRPIHQQHRAFGKIDLLVTDDTFRQSSKLLEVLYNDLPLPRPSNRKPYLPPEGGRKIVRQQFGSVSPQSPDFCSSDGFDGIQQLPVIARLTATVLLLLQIVGYVFLEVRQLSIRNEDIGEGLVAFAANTEKFNVPGFVRQALECQLDIRLAGKLDLQAQPAFQLQVSLTLHRLCCSGLQVFNLVAKGCTVLLPGQRRHAACRSTASRVRFELDGLRCVSKNEMWALSL